MAKALWLFGAALVVAGLCLLLYFVALLFWELGAFRNEILGAVLRPVDYALLGSPAWLTRLHIGMAIAVLGVAVGSSGVVMVRRQSTRISVERMRLEDRLRRTNLYGDDGRLEPFIGPGN
jgi:hypothetical protein